MAFNMTYDSTAKTLSLVSYTPGEDTTLKLLKEHMDTGPRKLVANTIVIGQGTAELVFDIVDPT